TDWRVKGIALRARLNLADVVVLTEDLDEGRWCAVPRLDLEASAIVLARESHAEMVVRFLGRAGASDLQPLSDAPAGWVGFQDVELVRAIPTDELALVCLSPLPMMEITLSGGLPLGEGRWLHGAPPAVSVQLPEESEPIELVVDGVWKKR